MNNKYKPFFVLASIIFLFSGGYFFYALKTEELFIELDAARIGQGVKDEKLEVTKSKLGTFDSVFTYTLRKPKCNLTWKSTVLGGEGVKHILLTYDPLYPGNCDLNRALLESYQLSVVKILLKEFDHKRIKNITIPSLNSWKLRNNITQYNSHVLSLSNNQNFTQEELIFIVEDIGVFNTLYSLFERFKLKIKLVSIEKVNFLGKGHEVFVDGENFVFEIEEVVQE